MARLYINELTIKSSAVNPNAQVKIIALPDFYKTQTMVNIAQILGTGVVPVGVGSNHPVDEWGPKFSEHIKEVAYKGSYTLDNNKKVKLNLVFDFDNRFYLYVCYQPQGAPGIFKLLDYSGFDSGTKNIGSINSVKNGFMVNYEIQNLNDDIQKVVGQNVEYTFSLDRVQCLKITETTISKGDEIYFRIKKYRKLDGVAVGNYYYFPNSTGYYRFERNGTEKSFTNIVVKFTDSEYLKFEMWEQDDGRDAFWDPDDKLREMIIAAELYEGSQPVAFSADSGAYNLFYRVTVKSTDIIGSGKRTKDEFTKPTTIFPKTLDFSFFFNKMKNMKASIDNIIKAPEHIPVTGFIWPQFILLFNYVSFANPEESTENDRIQEFIDSYYSNLLNNEAAKNKYLEELTHSQIPVMAYPVYPEPVYYYLKKLSDRFILPAIEAMPMNTMALFSNNPKFVEAFLCGMNTEMGRELLWREFPTDSRGSYFRKFWDTEVKKDITGELNNDSFFDVMALHTWENQTELIPGQTGFDGHPLGRNHTAGKDDLLIFAIKGEVLQKYPETMIFLCEGKLDGQKIVLDPFDEQCVQLLPDLSAWLSKDTFIVGFPLKLEDISGDPVTRDPGFFLTFMNKPSETRFSYDGNLNPKPVTHAGIRASNELVRPMVYGKHISQFRNGWREKK